MTTKPKASDKKTFWEHVADLRRVLFFSVTVLVASASLIYYYRESVVAFLLIPLGQNAAPLQFLSPLEPLLFLLKIAFVGGFVLMLPILLLVGYRFVRPTPWRYFFWPTIIIGISSGLALLGAAYAYYIVVPIVLAFMESLILPGTAAAFTASGFINFLLSTGLLLILIFEIPIATVLGALSGLLNPHQFKNHRRHVYLGVFVATAIITPTTDVITLLLISLPAIVVTELGVLVARWCYRAPA